jgi:outer membrane receptor for ferrienterochelin and colicin
MLRSVYSFVFSLLISISAFSQSGTVKGSLKDETTGEGLIGANVFLEGTTQGVVTDIEGNFTIAKVKAGKYNLLLSYVSYTSKTIPDIDVYPDQSTVINTTLKDASEELETVKITARRSTDTDISVITDLKKSDLVAVGISSQQIRMSQDRDAAQVIRRVPGITIVGNRFVNVRGLSERYSTVLLNGIIAPSTEVDSKAFSFDLIPSSMLDRMLVYKSGSPELPGEFAGADINIFTKNNVEDNSFSISVTGGYRANTTGKDVQLSEEKGKLDWIGIDDGTRKLPSDFPTVNLRTLNLGGPSESNELIKATKSLPNTWGTRGLTASPDFRANMDFARSFSIGEKKLDNITSVSYAVTNQQLELSQNYYDVFSTTLQKSTPRYQYKDTRFTQTNRLGAISNFTFEINPSHRIEFRNFYNQQGQNQSTFRTGTEDAQGFDVKNQSFNYFDRNIYSGQLSGKHSLSEAVTFNWILGFNNTNANQPDYRRIRSQRPTGTEDEFSTVIPPSASSFDAGRFYSKLNEKALSAAGNVEIKLNPAADDEKQTKLIGGYYLEQKNRDFNARWMSYKWINSSVIDNSILTQPFDNIFVDENLGTKFILEEGTNEGPDLYDKYKGYNTLLAGYAGIITPFADKFRLSAGLRVENNVQQIDVLNSNGAKKRVTDNAVTVPMPFLNLSYNFTEKMLMRIAYSKTVNRPVFRELAPFNYYDFDRNADIFGNKDLKTAKIDNIDLRWELYPSKSENISVGLFYKNFKDPIEQYLSPGSNLRYGYINADRALNYGAEVEIRKSLENLTTPFLSKLTFLFNAALIKSQITLPASLDNLDHNRAMQGQSPYVANASVYYNNAEHGLQVSVQYNVFGKRIYAVGDKDSNPNQYEMPRNQIDLTISKQLSRSFELKFGIQDVLNQKYSLMQDSNRDKKITGVDEVIQQYRFGQYATLGVVWKLN